MNEDIYPRMVLPQRDALSEGQDYYRGYVKGYEQGLNQAWDELIGLTTKGFSSREIQVMAKSKRQSVDQMVKDLKLDIRDETGIDLTTRSTVKVSGTKVLPGNAYIIEGNSATRALTIMNDLTSDGTRGMCILRSFPGNFQGAINECIAPFWLTKHENGGRDDGLYPTFSPSEMAKIVTETKKFMMEEESRVVLLEGIEYLIVQNDLNGVLKFLQALVDQVVITKSVLLLAIYPAAMDDRALSNLKCNIGSML
jgi:Protein of unknown function (DUF835)